MKEAVVNSSPLYNERIKYYGIEQVAFVHDEILFICPNENAQNPDVVKEIVRSMLRGSTRFSVPLRVSAAIGRDNWANLEEIDKSMLYD
jgi:DNA polymerase I-like protein with 3'-5' exonuclease and polymerase domains